MQKLNLSFFRLSTYINTGIQDKLNDHQNRLIQLTNIVALAIMLACLAGIGLYLNGFYFYSDDISILQGLIPLIQILIIFVVLHLNRICKYQSAKSLLVLSSIISILTIGLLFQPESGNNFFFILGPLGIFLFLGLNTYAYSLVFLSFILMLSVLTYQNIFSPIVPIADVLLTTNYIVSIVVVFTLITLMTYFLIQTNQTMEKRLTIIMETDPLTGLNNRLKYTNFTKFAFIEAYEKKQPISIIMVDIDFFKAYNDTYGHIKGDDTLVKVAHTLKKFEKNGKSLVARFGGEEFVIVLTNTDINNTVKIAELMLNDIQDMALEHKASLLIDIITCSAGAASIIPRGKDTFSDLLQKADQKLYQAKAQGRNQVAY